MTYDIITVGGAVIDALLQVPLTEQGGNLCMPTGTKLLVEKLEFFTGGGGTNTAAAFSKLGLKVGYIGKVGEDCNGNMIISELAKEKVDFLVSFAKENTGFSIIVDGKQKNRTILTYKGANENLSQKDFNKEKLRTRWFYFSSMHGKSFQTQEKLAQWAADKKIPLAYNPSSYLTRKGANHLKKILCCTTILVLNDEEAKQLIPEGDLFAGLHKLGPKIVCITYGSKGNKVSDKEKLYVSFPNKIKAKERTGAGDAFASGFVFGLMKFNDVKKAMQIGSLNAESVIQIPGAKNGLLTFNEAKNKLNKVKVAETALIATDSNN